MKMYRLDTSNLKVSRIGAAEKAVSSEAILIGWILRHPAWIQTLPGTTDPGRIRAAAEAEQVSLTREEWYSLFIAGRGEKLP